MRQGLPGSRAARPALQPPSLGRFDPDGLVEKRGVLNGGGVLPPDNADGQKVADPDLSDEMNLAATVTHVGSGGVIAVGNAVHADAGDLNVKGQRYARALAAFLPWFGGHLGSVRSAQWSLTIFASEAVLLRLR